MKHLLTTIIIFIFTTSMLFSQVSGVSFAKFGTPGNNTVAKKTIEFEPSFGFAVAKQKFDKDGKPINMYASDTTAMSSGLGLRMTYGIIDNLEMGLFMPSDFSEINLGMKYHIPLSLLDDKINMALIVGIHSPLGNQIFATQMRLPENTIQYAGGAIFSIKANDKLSMDISPQYQAFITKLDHQNTNDFIILSDIGYYVTEKTQFILGAYYYYTNTILPNYNPTVLNIAPGFTFEQAENFVIGFNVPVNVWGKNVQRSVGFSMALTMFLK